MDAQKRAEINHRHYISKKKYLKFYYHERWKEICEERKKAMSEYYERNKAMYAKEQAVIKTVRLEKGWSMKRLATEIGRSTGSVGHYETGRVKAPWADLIKAMPELEGRVNVEVL